MGGLKSLFTKVIPIVFLICFICVGITHTFGHYDSETGRSNITIISKKEYNIGTEENPKEFTYYEVDVNDYFNGLNNNFLHRSIEKVIDLDAYNSVLTEFEKIWANGYDALDIVRTIANAILLVINTVILPINIILVPLRIISGIILTSMAAVGIDVTTNGFLTKSLNAIIDHAAIPFAQITFNKETESLNNTMWQFNDTLYPSRIAVGFTTYNVNFTIPDDSRQFNGIKVGQISGKISSAYYTYTENNATQEYQVYAEQGHWINGENTKIIEISNNNLDNDYTKFMKWMDKNATQIYELPISQYYNQTFTWQQNAIDQINFYISIFSQIQIESNGNPYIMYAFASVNNQINIAYYPDTSSYTIVYDNQNNGWTNNAFKTFTIKEQYLSNSQTQALQRLQTLGLIA